MYTHTKMINYTLFLFSYCFFSCFLHELREGRMSESGEGTKTQRDRHRNLLQSLCYLCPSLYTSITELGKQAAAYATADAPLPPAPDKSLMARPTAKWPVVVEADVVRDVCAEEFVVPVVERLELDRLLCAPMSGCSVTMLEGSKFVADVS